MALISLNIGTPVGVPEVVSAPVTHQSVDIAELGATGTPIFGGYLRELGEYNAELTGLSAYSTYERMRRGDAQVKATLMAMKLPIRSAEWTVQEPQDPAPVEKEATEFVRSCLFEEVGFDSIVENALLMLDFGAAAHEDVYYIDGKNVRLKKCAARLPLTFHRWIVEPGTDTLSALEQLGYRGDQYVYSQVPASKLALFTFQQEGANFTGISALRSMYQHWYIKTNLYGVEAIACERNGMGVPWIEMGPNATAEDRQHAKDWISALAVNEKTGLLTPTGWKFSLVGVQGVVQSSKDAIAHHNSQITMAGLAHFLNLGQGEQGGSRALGTTMSDFFYLGLQALANHIARVLNQSTVKRLCDYNFAGMTRYPRVVPQQILSVKFEAVIEALSKLAAATVNVVQPDEELEDWLRQKIGAPVANNPRPRPNVPDAAKQDTATQDKTTMSEAGKRFVPKREPRGPEKFMALSEISSRLDQGRDEIAGALRAARPRVQAEILQKLMAKAMRDAHRVSVEPDQKLVDQIEAILHGMYEYGLQAVQDERARQSKGAAPADARQVRGAVKDWKRDPLGVYADGVVSEFTNNLQQRATNVVLDQRRRPGDRTVGEQIITAGQQLDEQSDGWIDNAAAKGANEAFADGRREGYDQHADEISEVQYSAILDANTCDPCSGADGESGATPDDVTEVPNPDCEGGDKCRCVHVYVFGDEVRGK